MSVGRKIYYEKDTGDVILEVPEKHYIDSVNTTKEQDFFIFDVLQVRNPEKIGVVQLEYGKQRDEFDRSVFRKINIETEEVLFQYPVLESSPLELITQLQNQLGDVLLERAVDKAKINELEASQGDLLMEIAMLKMGGNA